MTPDPFTQQKDVEFYSAGVTAWFNTTLEHDKSILALSAAGIGLLVTLLTTVGLGNIVLVIVYVLAIIFFLISLVCVLAIFRRNRIHIEQVFRGNSSPDPVLTLLDQLAVGCFGVAAILTAVIGVSTAIASYSAKENSMAKSEATPPVIRESMTKSFNGLGNLQSNSTATTTTSPASGTVAPSTVAPASSQPPATTSPVTATPPDKTGSK